VGISCSTSVTSRDTRDKNLMVCHERGNDDGIVTTTNAIYSYSYVAQIYRNR